MATPYSLQILHRTRQQLKQELDERHRELTERTEIRVELMNELPEGYDGRTQLLQETLMQCQKKHDELVEGIKLLEKHHHAK